MYSTSVAAGMLRSPTAGVVVGGVEWSELITREPPVATTRRAGRQTNSRYEVFLKAFEILIAK